VLQLRSVDRPPAPLFPSDLWAPEESMLTRIPLNLPPGKRRRRLKPVRWVRRTLVNPRGQVVEVDVPVYPSPKLDTEFAHLRTRYETRRQAK
jgi:hypothetical protein